MTVMTNILKWSAVVTAVLHISEQTSMQYGIHSLYMVVFLASATIGSLGVDFCCLWLVRRNKNQLYLFHSHEQQLIYQYICIMTFWGFLTTGRGIGKRFILPNVCTANDPHGVYIGFLSAIRCYCPSFFHWTYTEAVIFTSIAALTIHASLHNCQNIKL